MRIPTRVSFAEDREGPVAPLRRRESVAWTVAAAGFVVLANAPDGGYFPTTWGWFSAGLVAIVLPIVLLRPSLETGKPQALFLLSVVTLTSWIALSALWSDSSPASLREVERALVYVAFAAVLAFVPRASASEPLVVGALAGIVAICGYALGTRLVPTHLGVFDEYAGYRLAEPLGYWNALGLLAGMGLVLAVGAAAAAGGPALRVAGGASLAVLLPTMLFTFSRGAWLATGIGCVATLALTPRRGRYAITVATLALPASLIVWRAATPDALSNEEAALSAASAAGERLAIELVPLAVLGAFAAIGATSLADRLCLDRRPRRTTVAVGAAMTLAIVLAAGVAVATRAGGPAKLADRLWQDFDQPTTGIEGNLQTRLFRFSGGGRVAGWRVALTEAGEHPLLGAGAGTYELAWVRERDDETAVRDAHSLYLETLAELGPLGLTLVLLVVAVPLASATRARRSPLVPAAGATVAAFLVHAGQDWDWELAGLTLTAFLIGGSCLLAAGSDFPPIRVRGPRRVATVAVLVVAGGFGLLTLVGERALTDSGKAYERTDYARALDAAERSARLMPWSSAALLARGRAARALGELSRARASFAEAVRIDPLNWRSHYNLATVTTGRVRADALDTARRLNPIGVAALEGER